MQGETGERWKLLCEQAAKEQDSAKLLELIREINYLLTGNKPRRTLFGGEAVARSQRGP
jgi:hypothetical protein